MGIQLTTLWIHIATSPGHWPSSRRFVWEQSLHPSLLGSKNPHSPLTNVFFCIRVCSKWGGPPMKKHCSPCRHWSASVSCLRNCNFKSQDLSSLPHSHTHGAITTKPTVASQGWQRIASDWAGPSVSMNDTES